MLNVDLNCDLGESFGHYRLGNDETIMKYISSANIACGFHAGDPNIMRDTVKLALDHHVAIGAHPGLPDLIGFGRRNIEISPAEAYNLIAYQIGALDAFVKIEGGRMNHVKPHGALYNMCAVNPGLAEAVANAVADVNPELILFGLSGSALTKAGKKLGLKTANEVFADRSYRTDGTLMPRNLPGAVITEDVQALQQVIQMIKEKKVTTPEGKEISIQADTICIHGDGPRAVEFAELIFQSLTAEGISISAT
ncbi:lactam utilization protein LamB [Bacillus canaveralius]|uniref:5-oxoprolinase subunit A n=1 Tax=Bacillus canaveralius TaxID=1403243 RepID=A0A2N5GIL9_9BACI|nr:MULTISPECIES: 5-oxoprolinase subunit PxpA [Bacillus]PLR80835.1 lactam utilization protein LamB [Bacillus canaveralius]PLR81942.1 lactam utilization protein LamB [Bacillus sp. V33-4]PLR98399.1 lactam utilization protein LamB [Bacillus canaveralius]RSK52985.1 LamB/YcsF family protein [Bacillus canaveralius]